MHVGHTWKLINGPQIFEKQTLLQTSFLKILSAKLLTFEIASAGKDAKTFKLQQQSSRKILPIFSQTNL